MPGLIGYAFSNASLSETSQPSGLLERMADSLEHDVRFRRELYQGSSFGLGRLSLGIVNSEPQPVWNETGEICLVMEGEIFDYQDEKREMIEAGHVFGGENDAEFVLHLYEQKGETFAKRLNGSFAVAIWDERFDKLILVSDRMGTQPIYYTRLNDGLLFASGVRALLAEPRLSRRVDKIAIAQFLTFDHVLDDRTLLEAVKLLPQASLLIFQSGRLEIRPYWRLQYAEQYPLVREEELVQGLLFNLRRAVARQAHDELEAGVLLSGGLDSRMVFALLAERMPIERLHAFTWGIPGCDDVRFARELAKLVGVRHHFFELTRNWIKDKAEEAVRITDGLGNLVNLHALATAEAESQIANVIYKGFMGDAMMGFALVPRFWADYDDETRYQAHWETHRELGIITLRDAEQKAFFTESFQKELDNSVMESYRSGLDASNSKQLASQRLYFDLTQRVPRMTIKGVEVVRSHALVRLPFSDNDLIEFTTQVPPGYFLHRHLVIRAFCQAFPKLAKVPCTATDNLPLMTCARDVSLRAKQLVRWHLQRAGLGWLAGPSRRQYKDYNGWFRTNLRGWVEETLLTPRTLERGYYNPDSLQKLLEDHMAGQNRAVAIGALLSIEIWHRLFLD